jgi:DNA-binding transcriptional ArsR family regulator
MSVLQPLPPGPSGAARRRSDPSVHLLEDPRQVQALSSVSRLEIVDVLDHAGPASVAEIAAFLGRAAAPLYHHIRVLHRAGIIERVSDRRPSGHRGTLYALSDRRFARSVAGSRKSGRSTRAIGATLRAAEHEFRTAVEREVGLGIPVPSLRTMRHTARVTPEVLAEVDRRLDEVVAYLQANHDPLGDGEIYAWTTVLAPTVGRRPRGTPSGGASPGGPPSGGGGEETA